MLGVGFRRRGLAVASQVRTHDRVAGLDEQRGDLVPRRMRARMAVQHTTAGPRPPCRTRRVTSSATATRSRANPSKNTGRVWRAALGALHPTLGCVSSTLLLMSTQIAVRLPHEMVAFLDRSVATGRATSRAALVATAVEREMRRQAAEHDAAILRRGAADDLDDLVVWTASHVDVGD